MDSTSVKQYSVLNRECNTFHKTDPSTYHRTSALTQTDYFFWHFLKLNLTFRKKTTNVYCLFRSLWEPIVDLSAFSNVMFDEQKKTFLERAKMIRKQRVAKKAFSYYLG